jgi:hypothetical protein
MGETSAALSPLDLAGNQIRTSRKTRTTTSPMRMYALAAVVVIFAFRQVLLFDRFNSLQVFQNAPVLIYQQAKTPLDVSVKRPDADADETIFSPDLRTTSPTKILINRQQRQRQRQPAIVGTSESKSFESFE